MAEEELDSAAHDLRRLRIGLTQPTTSGAGGLWRVSAPVAGRVLKLHRDSEGPIAAGAAILDLGDPGQLEVVTDLLTEDAAALPAQAQATLAHWGGEARLRARLLRVEPGRLHQGVGPGRGRAAGERAHRSGACGAGLVGPWCGRRCGDGAPRVARRRLAGGSAHHHPTASRSAQGARECRVSLAWGQRQPAHGRLRHRSRARTAAGGGGGGPQRQPGLGARRSCPW